MLDTPAQGEVWWWAVARYRHFTAAEGTNAPVEETGITGTIREGQYGKQGLRPSRSPPRRADYSKHYSGVANLGWPVCAVPAFTEAHMEIAKHT